MGSSIGLIIVSLIDFKFITVRQETEMKKVVILLAIFVMAGSIVAPALQSAIASDMEPMINITEPANKSTISGKSITVKYMVMPGPKGDHVHLVVGGENAGLNKKMHGSFEIKDLKPGKHAITIKVMNSGHGPTGLEKSIEVTVK